MSKKCFNDENFLLQSSAAERLYHDHAAKMPIIDYHCHLNPEYVASDHRFRSLAEAAQLAAAQKYWIWSKVKGNTSQKL